MSEVVRHFPLTQEQERSLRDLRDSARMSIAEQLTPVASHSPNAYVEQAKNREKLIGQNTLRFIVQHTVREQTGLSHWFDFKQYMALDQSVISARLMKRV